MCCYSRVRTIGLRNGGGGGRAPWCLGCFPTPYATLYTGIYDADRKSSWALWGPILSLRVSDNEYVDHTGFITGGPKMPNLDFMSASYMPVYRVAHAHAHKEKHRVVHRTVVGRMPPLVNIYTDVVNFNDISILSLEGCMMLYICINFKAGP